MWEVSVRGEVLGEKGGRAVRRTAPEGTARRTNRAKRGAGGDLRPTGRVHTAAEGRDSAAHRQKLHFSASVGLTIVLSATAKL